MQMQCKTLGAYMILLCVAWNQNPGASLPNDENVLARWARLTKEEWEEVREEILACFTLLDDNRYYQKRLRLEYEKLEAKGLTLKKNADKRWHKKQCKSNAIALQKEGYSESESESELKIKTLMSDSEQTSSGIGTDKFSLNAGEEVVEPTKDGEFKVKTDDLQLIYDSYPKKVGRKRALESIRVALHRIIKEKKCTAPAAVAWLHERVTTFAKTPKGQSGQFCPNPETFFNQERYHDDDTEWNREAGSGRPVAETPGRVPAPEGKYARFRLDPSKRQPDPGSAASA